MSEAKTMADWCRWYEEKTGYPLNLKTLAKRRMVSGLGTLKPPGKRYYLTFEEFEKVRLTPLPFCSQVITGEE